MLVFPVGFEVGTCTSVEVVSPMPIGLKSPAISVSLSLASVVQQSMARHIVSKIIFDIFIIVSTHIITQRRHCYPLERVTVP